MKKVMVFGVFDGLHDGHRVSIKERQEARRLFDRGRGPRPHRGSSSKGHGPRLNLAERFAHLEDEDGVDEVVIGDEEQAYGTW